jgi:hypothetical protein
MVMSDDEARMEEATHKAKQHSGGLKIFSGNGNMLDVPPARCMLLTSSRGHGFEGFFCTIIIENNNNCRTTNIRNPHSVSKDDVHQEEVKHKRLSEAN